MINATPSNINSTLSSVDEIGAHTLPYRLEKNFDFN
jgi:hypothetical protein